MSLSSASRFQGFRYGLPLLLLAWSSAVNGQESAAQAPAPDPPIVTEAPDANEGGDLGGNAGEQLAPVAIADGPEMLPVVPLTLDLEAAQRIALEKNPSLFAAAARVEQARARVRQARSLYLPQLNAEYAASRTHLPANTVRAAKDQALSGPLVSSLSSGIPQYLFNPEQGGGLLGLGFGTAAGVFSGIQARSEFDEDVESYRASLTATYILFDGFSRHFTQAMARFGRAESEAARREVTRLLLDGVAQGFYGVQLARENVAIARADESFNQRLLKEARARRERGSGSKSDVLNFEVALRAAQSARIQAEGQEQVARVALAALMGLPDALLQEEVAIAELPSEAAGHLDAPAVETLLPLALDSRPDVQQVTHQVARIRAQLGERRSVYYPKVNAFAVQEAQTSDNSRFESDDLAATVGVNVSYNLFAGGRNRASVAEARYQLEEAEFLLEQTRLSAAQEVRQAGIELRTAQETLVLQRTTAEYVNENRDLVEKEYQAGQGSLARLNQAQRDLVAAQARLALARVALYSARHALETATGETISRFEGYMTEGATAGPADAGTPPGGVNEELATPAKE